MILISSMQTAKPRIFQTKTFLQNENRIIIKKVMCVWGLENEVVLGKNGYGNFTLATGPK